MSLKPNFTRISSADRFRIAVAKHLIDSGVSESHALWLVNDRRFDLKQFHDDGLDPCAAALRIGG